MIQGYNGLLNRMNERKNLVLPSMPVVPAEKNRIVLMAINPEMLFTYWDFEKTTLSKLSNQNIQGTLEVSSSQIEKILPICFNIKDEQTMNYYLKGLKSHTEYSLKLNVPGIDSLISNKVVTPRNYVSSDTNFVLGQF